jgi:transcriptional regulator of acetoin/glycerol metabolism
MNERPTNDSMSDASLLQWLLSQRHRPNVLVECAAPAIGAISRYVMQLSTGPRQLCRFPGVLALPGSKTGTLLLENVEALTAAQQAALHEWMSAGCAGVQIVSLSAAPLAHTVQRGEFLEALFYRLNVVRIDAPAASSILLTSVPEAPPPVPRPRIAGSSFLDSRAL